MIYLAPPTVRDAVHDEHLIVARQGLVFINIPIRFDGPTEADFDAFSAALGGLGDRRVPCPRSQPDRTSTVTPSFLASGASPPNSCKARDSAFIWGEGFAMNESWTPAPTPTVR